MGIDCANRDGRAESRSTDEVVSRLLEQSRQKAPGDLVGSVMDQLPAPAPRAARFPFSYGFPIHGWWMPAAVGGAAAALLVVLGLWLPGFRSGEDTVRVTFELHAPEAEQVELVGSFNQWEVGSIVLEGPDPSGHWTTTVELARGRHEYCFLVDGRTWIADPNATTRRPDGFGRENALLDI